MPQDWNTYKLGDIATLQRGFDLPSSKRRKGSIPVIAASGIGGFHNIAKVKGPGVITGRSGTIGKVLYEEGDFWPLNTALWVKNFHGNDEKYIFYLLSNFDFSAFNNGTSVPTLNRNDVHAVDFTIPPLPEQQAIASILSALDDKIELNLQMNKTLEEMAMTLYKHWFVDFGPFQDGEFVDSELGKIPKDWRIADLGDVSEMIAGGDKPINYSYQPNEACKIPIYSNGLTNEGLYGYTDRPRINQESITVSARGTIGFVCLRMQPYFPIVRLISVIPNQDYISSKYLYLLLKNQNIRGTGTTQQQLTVPDFKKTKVIIPKIELVNDFTFIMDSIFNNIRSNKSEVKTLSQTRDTILPKLISGEVRVKDIEQTVTAVL